MLWPKHIAELKSKTKSKVFNNNRHGYAELLVWQSKQVNRSLKEILVMMETTSIYHEALAHCLFDYQLNVSVMNPA